MATYDKNLAIAEQLPFRYHWVIGAVLSLAGMAIENPSAILQDWQAIAVGMLFFGVLTGIISKIILVKVLPTPYAMLAVKLGLVQPAA